MKLLDRYLTIRLIVALLRTLTVFTALYILVDLLSTRLQQIEKQDVSWWLVLRYYAVLMPHVVVQYVAPLAVLTASLFVFGEMAQNNEVTAALAGGVSLRRLVRAPVVAGFLFSILTFAAQESIGPAAYRQAQEMNRRYFGGESIVKRSPVTWANLTDNWTCHILKFNRIALTGEGIVMYSQQEDGKQYLIEAQRIFWDETQQQWFLQRGMQYVFDPATQSRVSNRITVMAAPFAETPDQLFSLDKPPESKTIKELWQDLVYARSRDMYTPPLEVKFHQRFSQPMLSFVMMVLAVPFGMRLKRGGLAVSFGAAIGVAVAYLLLFFVSSGLGQMGRLPAFAAAWLASVVFLGVGTGLLFRTPT